MNTQVRILAVASTLMLALSVALSQPKPLIKQPGIKTQSKTLSDILRKYNLPTFQIKNLTLLKSEDPITQMRVYSSAASRGAVPPVATNHAAKSSTVNGVEYKLQAAPFSTGESLSEISAPVTQTSNDGVRICEKVKERQEEILEVINNYGAAGNIAPGMIFTDQSVLQGTFSQIPGLSRKPFQLTTDLVDFSSANLSNLEEVPAPHDLGRINLALSSLFNRLKNSPIPARIYSEVFELHAEAQMRLSMEANASANLEALIQLPLEVTANQSFSNDSRFEFNHVVATVIQPYYTVSVANPPWELVNGTPSTEAVVVSNVIYGRMAIITATSALASQELKLNVDRIVNAVDLASVEATLSAEQKALFQARSIKVQILGGNAQNAAASAVGSFEEFKNYIKGIEPTVQGSLGVPLAYIFRFVSDDAPVFIKGISEFDKVECRRAKRLRVTNASIKVTKVFDAPGFPSDEELFGSINLKLGNSTKNLWSQSSGSVIKKAQDQSITINTEPEFEIDPNLINTYKLSINMSVKDKIEGPEFLGATDKGKSDGFVTYSPGTVELNVKDVQNANGGVLAKTFTLEESSAQVKVFMTFRLVE